MHRDVVRPENGSENYLEKLRYVLANKKEKARFPADDELSARNIYAMPSKNKTYLFERLENQNSNETVNVIEKLDNGDYTIEHIMPQTLTGSWVKMLGENYQQIHETWLHRLANLTITGYNSKYSNRSFMEKRDITDGFKDSNLRLNKGLSHLEQWSEREIQQRGERLVQLALELWPMPASEYQPPEKPYEEYNLADDMDFTGKIITKYSFEGIEEKASSWVDMYSKVLTQLHSRDATVLSRIAVEQSGSTLSLYIVNQEPVQAHIKLDEGIYAITNNNTQTKINLLRKLLTLFETDLSELVF